MVKNKIIPIKDIVIDEEIYPRLKTSSQVVEDYFMAMKKGDSFPNIDVGKFKNKYWLIDGKHRLEAYQLKGEKFVTCDVRNVASKKDIYLASIRANLKHGSRLTKADKTMIAGKLEKMKIDALDISKLLNMRFKNVNKIMITRMKKEKIGGNLPNVLKFGRQQKKYEEPPIMDVKQEQELELENFLEYLKETEFVIHKKKFKSMLTQIQKQIRLLMK